MRWLVGVVVGLYVVCLFGKYVCLVVIQCVGLFVIQLIDV